MYEPLPFYCDSLMNHDVYCCLILRLLARLYDSYNLANKRELQRYKHCYKVTNTGNPKHNLDHRTPLCRLLCSFLFLSSRGSRILVWEWHWQEVWGTEVPQRGPGAEFREGLGWSLQKPEECYLMKLTKPLTERKNKSIQTDIVRQYHNYDHLIHSSFCFQPFLS